MNIPLLRKVKAAILKHPNQFEMGSWFSDTLFLGYDKRTGRIKERPAGGCGTAACIAGWACHVALGHRKLYETDGDVGQSTSCEASDLLGLTEAQSSRLFFDGEWPRKHREQLEDAKTLKGRARAASDRISHFIATKGAE